MREWFSVRVDSADSALFSGSLSVAISSAFSVSIDTANSRIFSESEICAVTFGISRSFEDVWSSVLSDSLQAGSRSFFHDSDA
jgi:hypothetical protein